MSEQQPVSPKKVWKTFKNPGELLLKTTFKKLQKRQAQWKENINVRTGSRLLHSTVRMHILSKSQITTIVLMLQFCQLLHN